MKKNKSSNFEKILFYAFCIFSTMPCITITLFGRMVSIFTILTPIMFVYLFFRSLNSKVKFNKSLFCLMLFLAVSLFSTIIGVIFYADNDAFKTVPASFLPKIIVYIGFIFLFGRNKFTKYELSILIKGLFLGALLNVIWADIDGLGFYITGRSLNNIVFRNYISYNKIRYDSMSLIINGSIRASGFNYDPAHIGFLAVFVFGYSFICNKKLELLFSVLSILMSQSAISLVGCFIFLLIYLIVNKANKKMIIKRIFGLIVITAVFLLFIFIVEPDLISTFIRRMLDKVGSNSVEHERITYNFKVIIAMFNAPVNTILGTGFGTASYPYILSELTNDLFAYDPETTYISYLFDVGIAGIIFYIACLVYLVKSFIKAINSKVIDKTNIMIFCGLVALIVSQLFYHYTLYAPQMLLLILAGVKDKQLTVLKRKRSLSVDSCDGVKKSKKLANISNNA